jgi:hypothetical protein
MRGIRALVPGAIVMLSAALLPLTGSAQAESTCEWLAGDFHVHTVYSHDSWGGPASPDDNTDPLKNLPGKPDKVISDAITFGWTPGEQGRIAEGRALDFIAITDHDDTRAQSDPWFHEYGQDFLPNPAGGHDLIWIPDYENTVSGSGGAHAQMHGATEANFPKYEDPSIVGPIAAAELIRSDGGAFQINHPADMRWHDDDGNYQYPGFAPDALEVWNIGAWLYEPPAPATNDHEFVLNMWNELLDEGFHVAGTGGSDNHWRSTTSLQGVGQPTTWVCAQGRSADAIIEGVKANRTSVSNQPPAYFGARAYLYADGDGDGSFESMIGDSVKPGSTIQAVIENAEGAELRLVTNGGEELAQESIDSSAFSDSFEVPEASTWVRVEVFYPDGQESRRQLQALCDLSEIIYGPLSDEPNTYCENRLAVVALTSPIYFTELFDPTTTLTYDGATEVKVGDTATLSATLLDSKGAPLANQPVTFTFRGATYSATTGADGRAATDRIKVNGPPGTYEVVSLFAGTDTYSQSQDADPIWVTTGNIR